MLNWIQKRLDALEGVTAGVWWSHSDENGITSVESTRGPIAFGGQGDQAEADIDHIAAYDPDTVRQLLMLLAEGIGVVDELIHDGYLTHDEAELAAASWIDAVEAGIEEQR